MLEGFHGGSEGKESACNARHSSLIPGLGASPGEGMCDCPQGHKESDLTEQLTLYVP